MCSTGQRGGAIGMLLGDTRLYGAKETNLVELLNVVCVVEWA